MTLAVYQSGCGDEYIIENCSYSQITAWCDDCKENHFYSLVSLTYGLSWDDDASNI